MKRVVVVAVPALVISAGLVLLGLWVAGDSGVTHNAAGSAGVIALTCAASAGQQGRRGEVVVDGVARLVLPGSGNPSSLTSILGPRGRTYYVYKVFLAVSSSDAPFATVSIVSPANARLYYGSPLGDVALVLASKRKVRLPVCGPRFSGYAGGVVLVAPSRVTLQVTTPSGHSDRVGVSIGNG